jgi:plasmid stabilization system protein ParE
MAKRKIAWSHKANIKLFEILDFYEKRNKSKDFSAKLYKRFNEELALLNKQPGIGIKTDLEAIRGLIVDKFILFYEVTSDNIIVHTLWDCRQNPGDLKIK